jgi:hypothetical protein
VPPTTIALPLVPSGEDGHQKPVSPGPDPWIAVSRGEFGFQERADFVAQRFGLERGGVDGKVNADKGWTPGRDPRSATRRLRQINRGSFRYDRAAGLDA